MLLARVVIGPVAIAVAPLVHGKDAVKTLSGLGEVIPDPGMGHSSMEKDDGLEVLGPPLDVMKPKPVYGDESVLGLFAGHRIISFGNYFGKHCRCFPGDDRLASVW